MRNESSQQISGVENYFLCFVCISLLEKEERKGSMERKLNGPCEAYIELLWLEQRVFLRAHDDAVSIVKFADTYVVRRHEPCHFRTRS
jgi:hypothetical protein